MQSRLWTARRSPIVHDAKKQKASAELLLRQVRAYLVKASECGLLQDSLSDVHNKIRFAEYNGTDHSISVGNVRNFGRDRELPHFTRKIDDGWFDFQILVREEANGLLVLAYDFELRLPSANTFFRFDLNPAGHANEVEGMRSHLHAGSDDDGCSVPSPVMSPYELLDLMVHGYVKTGRQRHREQIK